MDWLSATFPACRVAGVSFTLRSMRRIVSPGSARDVAKTEADQTASGSKVEMLFAHLKFIPKLY